MMKWWKTFFVRLRFFYALGGLIMLLAASYAFPWLFFPARLLVAFFFVGCVVEATLLFSRNTHLTCERKIDGILSLGDENLVTLHLRNKTSRHLHVKIIEELPYQLQNRDFLLSLSLGPNESKQLTYPIVPTERGSYEFGHTLLFTDGIFRLFSRRFTTATPTKVAVYPSLVQVKKFQLHTSSSVQQLGVKKTRRVGHNYEFDHIKSYVRGDDYRSINWKSTGKRNSLMVNQYDDERAQSIYCILDLGRAMHMPFGGLSLLDYSINASLVLSNTALQKHDRAGLISFAKSIHTFLKADAVAGQKHKLFQHLYNEKESDLEPNFELLYQFIRRNVTVRSSFFLFTNFESHYGLQRVLPILRLLNKFHLLVVIFFENEELKSLSTRPSKTLDDVYDGAIAEKLLFEKKQLVNLLRQHGIQSLFTSPRTLTVNVLNKYLELKSRGLT